jgi:glycerate kinase
VSRPVLVAPDKFKGTLRASEVAAAIGRGLEAGGWDVDRCPVADGGEGTHDALVTSLGGEIREESVSDPLGRPVDACFALLGDGRTAVVEMAAASGLGLLAPSERDPETASTRGTGELIAAAVAAGASEVLVAAGGSATVDGGAGALAALEDAGGVGSARLVVLCDVRTPWELAAGAYGPQKGAGPETVLRLGRRLDKLARSLPRDPRGVPMGGAAGGLAGGLWAVLEARLVGGARFVLDSLDFDRRLRAARAVVTGEGRLDEGTLEGKAAGEVATRARQAGVPAFAVAGSNALDLFDQRILDLGKIIEAGTAHELEAAGRTLAATIGMPGAGANAQ